MPISVKCSCGKVLSIPDSLAGQKVKCPQCSQPVLAGGGPAKTPSASSGLGPMQKDGPKGKGGQGPKIPKPKCKRCGHDMEPAALICVACGLNQSTGRSVAGLESETRPRPEPKPKPEAAEEAEDDEEEAPPPLPVGKVVKIVLGIVFVAAAGYVAIHYVGRAKKDSPAAPAKPDEATPGRQAAGSGIPGMEKVEAKPITGPAGEWFLESALKAPGRAQDKLLLISGQQAVDAFKVEKGRLPKSVDEVVKAGYGPLKQPSGGLVLGVDPETGQVGLYQPRK